MIRLLVGLGNPGPEYDATRHNAGFWWLDAAARQLGASLVAERGFFGLAARVQRGGQSTWLLEPMTYMNLRLGIGHPGVRAEVVDYVLKKPSPEDREAIRKCIDESLAALDLLLAGEMERAMMKIHAKPPRPKPPRPAPLPPEQPA